MTAPVRTPGKLGRLSAKFPEGLRDLTHYVAGDLPKAPASVAVPDFASWGMLGNSDYGDCGVAGLQHLMEADATDAGETEQWPTDDQAVSYYLAYTGGQDNGVVLSDYLAHVRQQGYYGHTVSAYAPVSVHDVPTLQSVIALYDGAYCGIAVTAQMQEDFADGQPWTLESLQSEVVGGHCVPAVGFDSQYLYVVTWGSVQAIEWSAWHYMISEAWAVLTGELANGDGHGVSLDALKADLDKLDAPAPVPAPAQHPGLLGELAALIRDVEESAEQEYGRLLEFLASHGL